MTVLTLLYVAKQLYSTALCKAAEQRAATVSSELTVHIQSVTIQDCNSIDKAG